MRQHVAKNVRSRLKEEKKNQWVDGGSDPEMAGDFWSLTPFWVDDIDMDEYQFHRCFTTSFGLVYLQHSTLQKFSIENFVSAGSCAAVAGE